MTTDLTLPTVHLNGTGREGLAEGYFEAWNRLNEAIAAFRAIEFNARDYYVQSDSAWAKARTERDCAAAHLHQAHAYLEAHLIHLGE